jgi:ATP-dependent exoDNAse (exonuclease V) alpha subunit
VSSHAEHISGLVERVTFHSATSGFAVLRVKARGHRELVTVVGTAPSVAVGEWIQATGTWRIDSQYGQQLRDLLYTAITRARKLLVMVGTKRAIATATHRVGSRTRVTTLQERLRDEGEHVG